MFGQQYSEFIFNTTVCYSLARLTYVLLLHYLGETSHVHNNNFGNKVTQYTLPLRKKLSSLSTKFHTTSLHMSQNTTTNVQNDFLFHPYRPEVSYAIHQQHRPQCFATRINQALPRVSHVSNWSLMYSSLYTARPMVGLR